MPANFPTAYFEEKQTIDLVPLLINGHSYKNDYRHNSGVVAKSAYFKNTEEKRRIVFLKRTQL
jgi:hypothetical protein